MEHLRNVGSAVLGWVVMGLLVFGLMSLLWQVLGPERAFQPESWEVTGAWIVLTILLGVIARGGRGARVRSRGGGRSRRLDVGCPGGRVGGGARAPGGAGGDRYPTGECVHDGGDEPGSAAHMAHMAEPGVRGAGGSCGRPDGPARVGRASRAPCTSTGEACSAQTPGHDRAGTRRPTRGAPL